MYKITKCIAESYDYFFETGEADDMNESYVVDTLIGLEYETLSELKDFLVETFGKAFTDRCFISVDDADTPCILYSEFQDDTGETVEGKADEPEIFSVHFKIYIGVITPVSEKELEKVFK